MSSGRDHAKASAVVAAAAGATALFVSHDVAFAVGVSAGSLLGIALSPDLDQETISSFEWRLIKRTFGLGFLWLMYWWPYAIFIPHRSPISHAPLLGTIVRVLYLGPLLWLAWPHLPLWSLGLALPIFVGLCLSDLAHWAMDVLPKAFSKHPRRGRRVTRRPAGL